MGSDVISADQSTTVTVTSGHGHMDSLHRTTGAIRFNFELLREIHEGVIPLRSVSFVPASDARLVLGQKSCLDRGWWTSVSRQGSDVLFHVRHEAAHPGNPLLLSPS